VLNRTALVLVTWIATLFAVPTEDIVEHFPTGEVQRKYQVNALGERHGTFIEFAVDGTILIKSQYADDELDGREQRFYPNGAKMIIASYAHGELDGGYQSYFLSGQKDVTCGYKEGELHGHFKRWNESGTWHLKAAYKNGKLEGKLKLEDNGRVISQQVWKRGVLQKLDGMEPFSQPKEALIEQLVKIQEQLLEGDEDEQERQFALHRLQVYRALCKLNWRGMTLNPERNESCYAAAEICRRLGKITHTPERPPNTDDDLYEKGRHAAGVCNLTVGFSLSSSVDVYMDDSGVQGLGHRRWCLDPSLEKTGFGRSDKYTAMWAMDNGGSAPKSLGAVMFPPAGYVPVEMFGAKYAWSITPLKGSLSNKENVHITVQKLDRTYLPDGAPLPIYDLLIANGSRGSGPTLIFSPGGIELAAGTAYRCRVSYDAGKTIVYDYVVEFVSDKRLKGK
jgi:hypothetical protein